MDALKELNSRKFGNLNPRVHHHHQKDISSDYNTQEDENEVTRLKIVDLSALSLDNVPENPNSINPTAICKFNISNNNLQNISESVMARLLNVVALDVHSNQLTCLPNSIGCLSKLKLLNVSGNLLRSIPKSIENCRGLEELIANFNNLAALPETIGFELINLKKLSVNSNQISFLPYSTSHLTALLILDVRLNRLRSLPDDLHNMVNLQVLNISQNFHYLEILPSSIGHITSLVELDISYNKIKILPASLAFSKLQKLCVEGNPLVSPPVEVAEMGFHAVKAYLDGAKEKKEKKVSWFKKHLTMNGRVITRGAHDDNDVVEKDSRFFRYSRVDAIASPRYFAMLSPRRLFFSSPNSYYTKLA